MTEEQIESLEKEEDDAFEHRRNILQDLQHSYDEVRFSSAYIHITEFLCSTIFHMYNIL